MSQSKIEWTDWTLNPVKGKCPMACPYCYARGMYDDFKWNPKVRFCPSVFNNLPKKPVRVFVGSTIELFLFDDWVEFILNRCQDFPQHTFMFLTKLPEKLPQWSPFPSNCQVGVTAVNSETFASACLYLREVEAKLKYLSIEPYIGMILNTEMTQMILEMAGIGWLIIGALTGKKSKIMELAKQYPDLTPMPWGRKWTLQPKIEWVVELAQACDKAGIPVFLKDNLSPLLKAGGWRIGEHKWITELRQEMPVDQEVKIS